MRLIAIYPREAAGLAVSVGVTPSFAIGVLSAVAS